MLKILIKINEISFLWKEEVASVVSNCF